MPQMIDLAKLMLEYDGCLNEQENVLADRQKAQSELLAAKDDAGKAAAKARDVELEAKYKDLVAKSTSMEKQLDAAKEYVERVKKRDEMKALAEPDAKGMFNPHAPEKLPAAGRNIAEEEKAHMEAFQKYCLRDDEHISGQQADLLAAKSSAFDEKDGERSLAAKGVLMPRRLSRRLLGGCFPGFSAGHASVGGKAIPLTVDDTGAYLFQAELLKQLIQLPTEGAHVLNRATVFPAPAGGIKIPRLLQTDVNEYGGVSIDWTDDGGEKPDSEPTFEQVSITAHELAGYTEISHALLSRSVIDLEQTVAGIFGNALIDAMEIAFLTGNGTGQPLGINQTVGMRTVARETAGTVTRNDLIELKYALQSYHRANAIYMLDDTVTKTLEKMVDGEDRPLYTAQTDSGIWDRLHGHPFISTTRLATMGSNGDVIFGDLRWYYIAMEQDLVVKRSDHYKFRTNCAAFAVFARVGGKVVAPRMFAKLVGTSGS